MIKTIGSFIIRDEGDGTFFFKFRTNLYPWKCIAVCTKSNDETMHNKFEGEYVYVWELRDDKFNIDHGIMTITSTYEGSHDLIWKDESNTIPLYYGQGMRLGKNLIGCFWDDNINQVISENCSEEGLKVNPIEPVLLHSHLKHEN